MDSSGAMKNARRYLRPEAITHQLTLGADADVGMQLHELAGACESIELTWVKSHQDDTRTFATLPRAAQLNVLADTEADRGALLTYPSGVEYLYPAGKVYLVDDQHRPITRNLGFAIGKGTYWPGYQQYLKKHHG